MRSREEHIEWCKQRALEHIENGDIDQALDGMVRDLSKHEETKNHPGTELMFVQAMYDLFGNAKQVKSFIEGFN